MAPPYIGDWESLVNPSALGAEDPQFESEISDQFYRTLAQLVERLPYTQNVGGSNPSRPTNNAGMM